MAAKDGNGLSARERQRLEKHIASLERVRAQYLTVMEADEREGRLLRVQRSRSRIEEIDRLLESAQRRLGEGSTAT